MTKAVNSPSGHGETEEGDRDPNGDNAKAEAIVRMLEERQSHRERQERQSRRLRKEKHRSSRSDKRRKSKSPRSRHKQSSKTRRHKRRSPSRSPRRRHKRRHRSRSSSRSVEYGGYIPRKRNPKAQTGFDAKGNGISESRVPQVYVGNLVPGLVSDMALRQLFNSALSAAFPNNSRPGSEPVVSVSMHSDGRYAFIELRSPEMATAALLLSGQVQLFGQSISVGRPSGYVDPSKAAAAAQAAAAALAACGNGEAPANHSIGNIGVHQHQVSGQAMANAAMISIASPYISIEGLVDLKMLSSGGDYSSIVKTLRNECVKYGPVVQLKIPKPAAPGMAKALFNTGFYGKAFVQFADISTAMRAKEGLLSMATGDKTLSINHISQEVFSAIL